MGRLNKIKLIQPIYRFPLRPKKIDKPLKRLGANELSPYPRINPWAAFK